MLNNFKTIVDKIESLISMMNNFSLLERGNSMFTKIKAKLFHEKVEIPTLLNGLNERKLKLGDSIQIEGTLLPYYFSESPKTFVSSKAMAFPMAALYGKEENTIGLMYLPTGIPIKYNYIEIDKKDVIAMLYPISYSLQTKVSGEADHYHSNAIDNNLAIPIKIRKQDYHRFLYKKIACLGKVMQMDDDLRKRISLSNDALVTDLNRAFINPFQMNIHEIYINGLQIKRQKKESKSQSLFSYCIEFRIKDSAAQDDILKDLRIILQNYNDNKFKVKYLPLAQGNGTIFVLWASNIYIQIVNNYIGFYVDLTLDEIDKTIQDKERLSKIAKFYMRNTEFTYEISYISDEYLI